MNSLSDDSYFVFYKDNKGRLLGNPFATKGFNIRKKGFLCVAPRRVFLCVAP